MTKAEPISMHALITSYDDCCWGGASNHPDQMRVNKRTESWMRLQYAKMKNDCAYPGGSFAQIMRFNDADVLVDESLADGEIHYSCSTSNDPRCNRMFLFELPS